MNEDGELSLDELEETMGGLNHDLAVERGKNSKFHSIREMALKEEEKMNMDTGKSLDEELKEEDLDKIAYDYYHNDEKIYRR